MVTHTPRSTGRNPPRAPSDTSDVPLTWLDRRLQGLHEGAAEEPLPDDMAEMLGQLRAKQG